MRERDISPRGSQLGRPCRSGGNLGTRVSGEDLGESDLHLRPGTGRSLDSTARSGRLREPGSWGGRVVGLLVVGDWLIGWLDMVEWLCVWVVGWLGVRLVGWPLVRWLVGGWLVVQSSWVVGWLGWWLVSVWVVRGVQTEQFHSQGFLADTKTINLRMSESSFRFITTSH